MPAPLDLFLSSTCYDLADARAELAKFLEQHSFLVRLSDDYESHFSVNGRVDSIGSCLFNVEHTDVVVSILDRRYGPKLPQPHEYAGVSATHAELLHARKFSKPIFTFTRDRTLGEYKRILAAQPFKPEWVDPDSCVELSNLVKEQRDLAEAVTDNRSNWFDQFTSVVDLKPRILKRLLDQFPEHIGAYTRNPDRMVRLYLEWRGNNTQGLVAGTFRNAGNGPALNINSGWNVRGSDRIWHRQGALMLGDEIGLHSSDSRRASYSCPPEESDLFLYCEYENAYGDRYRVEAPLVWTPNGYVRVGPERFKILVGDEWLLIH